MVSFLGKPFISSHSINQALNRTIMSKFKKVRANEQNWRVMKNIAFLSILFLLFSFNAYSCDSNHYEKCYSACIVPNPLGGCIQEVRDCKCLPKVDGTIGEIGEKTKEATQGAEKFIQKVAEGTVTTLSKLGEGTHETLEELGGRTISTVAATGKDVITKVSNTGSDVIANYTKGLRDTTEQAKRSFEDATEAGGAMLRYQERVLADQAKGLGAAERRVREGKVVDAAWGLATEPLQSQEKNFFKATQESTLVNQAAGSAAAIYGGPGGAAAYASWSTYKSTGDASIAFRAGLIAGASAQFGQGAPLSSNAPISQVVQRASVAGAAGGIAIAAQGGDEAAIRDGFLKSAGAVLIQTGKTKLDGYSPSAAQALNLAECVSAKDVDCLSNTSYVRDAKGRIIKEVNGIAKVDPSKINPAQHIGQWTGVDLNEPQAKGQKIITDISKLPNGKVIALFNGQMVLTTTLGTNTEIEYGKPMVVLTSTGPTAPFTFLRKVGNKQSTSINSAGNYNCRIGENKRTITTTRRGTSCVALYKREDGSVQTIWRTPSKPEACVGKAIDFVKHLASIGVACRAK